MQNYTTNIVDYTKEIVALSDIHSDIHNFIIALRDCAKVIRKKKMNKEINQGILDQDMEDLLELDLNSGTNDTKYIPDLNYEWCCENKYIVIVGDIIDGYRGGFETSDNINTFNGAYHIRRNATMLINQYPQVEIKILKFINALNKQSSTNYIFKLLGNHELMNIFGSGNNYAFPSDKFENKVPYYMGQHRNDIFLPGNIGCTLLFEGGCGILIKINNSIFVHGRLSHDSIDYFDRINRFINDPKNHNNNKMQEWVDTLYKSSKNTSNREFLDGSRDDTPYLYLQRLLRSSKKYTDMKLKLLNIKRAKEGLPKFIPTKRERETYQHRNNSGKTSELWDRIHSTDQTAKRLDYKLDNLTKNKDEFCADIIKDLIKFKDVDRINENVEQLRIIVGHCIQSEATLGNTTNMTIDNTKMTETAITRTYTYSVPYIGKADLSNNILFGITMECNHANDNRVYHVDIGSSRGFDDIGTNNEFKKGMSAKDLKETERKHLGSRTPQVLMIQDFPESSKLKPTIKIVKSKMKNTRIHAPRIYYEKHIATNNITDLDKSNVSYMEKKYIKYKIKYLGLLSKPNI
jgi:hypothetical protein